MTGPTTDQLCPQVQWAQRKDRVIVTINTTQCPKDYKLEVLSKKIVFSGQNASTSKKYALDLELYGEIVTEEYKKLASDRSLQLCLTRKEQGDYWPRLLETKQKLHYIKTDFDRWRDEDETDDEDESKNWENMMGNMNIGGEEMEDGEEEEEDSDDDSLPDLEDDKPKAGLEDLE